MAVITKEEIRGNPKPKATKAPTVEAAVAATPTSNVLGSASVRHIGSEAERTVGSVNVTTGALERAEGHVAAASPFPKPSEQPKRIVVTREGKVIAEGAATEGGVVLVGAEAEAYLAKHGGVKEAAQADNKARKSRPATKAKRTTSVSARGSRQRSSKARRR